jgi:hypothetical protein
MVGSLVVVKKTGKIEDVIQQQQHHQDQVGAQRKERNAYAWGHFEWGEMVGNHLLFGQIVQWMDNQKMIPLEIRFSGGSWFIGLHKRGLCFRIGCMIIVSAHELSGGEKLRQQDLRGEDERQNEQDNDDCPVDDIIPSLIDPAVAQHRMVIEQELQENDR